MRVISRWTNCPGLRFQIPPPEMKVEEEHVRIVFFDRRLEAACVAVLLFVVCTRCESGARATWQAL